MDNLILHNMRLLDCQTGQYIEGAEVLIEGDTIREVSDKPLNTGGSRIDLGGRTLMPGLIDAHVHVVAHTMNLGTLPQFSPFWVSAKASEIMKGMLFRGFTTVRDAGGADFGLKDAVEQELMVGPRLFISGKILTPTGGNNDYRPRTISEMPCACCGGSLTSIGRVVDGEVEVRKAARDELRRGADQIKCNASGGVSGPNGNMDTINFTVDELRCMVEEADGWNKYAMAHAYTPRTIRRAVEAGFRSIEHGNMVDADTAELMAAQSVFMVPTLSIFHVGSKLFKQLGYGEVNARKLQDVRNVGLGALKICGEAGVRMGFGTDLLGDLHQYQSEEFTIRTEVLTPLEVLQSATVVNAELLQMKGKLGVIAPDAFADLIVVDGDPLEGLDVLQEQGRRIPAIMKGGKFYKNEL